MKGGVYMISIKDNYDYYGHSYGENLHFMQLFDDTTTEHQPVNKLLLSSHNRPYMT